ncbi:Chromosome partition protein Smc [Pseudovibrio sp. Ad13]|uniref:hypothetical protein n=1 Tax=Pseudovibrio sp. Ad13 TaxID=989396 RepID=UPI0007B1F5BB|nr:hypothetical protein [Pseudovibrio sp. Ad13]KZK83014.1 Chromosome partition protein Smc [Pseudovibrio sp. Ad13]
MKQSSQDQVEGNTELSSRSLHHAENLELKRQLNAIDSELQKSRELLHVADKERKFSETKLENLQAEKHQLYSQVNDARKQLELSKEEYASLSREASRLNGERAELKSQRDDIVRLHEELSSVIDVTKDENNSITAKNTELSEANTDLQLRLTDVLKDRRSWLLQVFLLVLFSLSYVLAVGALFFNNLDSFSISPSVLTTINNAMNVGAEIAIPFLFGCIGALTRVMIAGVGQKKSAQLVVASGIIAAFSWVSIKSKLFISIVAPHLLDDSKLQEQVASDGEIYTLVLVSALVGMFASNIYIFIDQRVRQLTAEAVNNKEDKQPE